MGSEHTGWKTDRLSHWLVANWAKSFSDVVAALDFSGAAGEIQLNAREPNPDSWQEWEEALWLDFAVNAAEGAVISVGCAKAAARQITELITGEDEVDDQTAEETYIELLNQVSSSISSVVSEKLGTRVEFSAAAASSQPPEASLAVEYTFAIGDGEHLLVLAPNGPCVEALYPPEIEQPEIAEATSAGAGGSGAVSVESPAGEGSAAAKEVSTSCSPLGPAHSTTWRCCSKWSWSSASVSAAPSFHWRKSCSLPRAPIVELNRSVTDPVDVMVNNCVIARGDVVVVDGNYGIRVTEIVSRQERIRSIF